jgi:hypothetical protein
VSFQSNARHDGYTHSAALSPPTDFTTIQPVQIQGAFREIDDALRLNGAANHDTAAAIDHLRRAAAYYVLSTRNSHALQ